VPGWFREGHLAAAIGFAARLLQHDFARPLPRHQQWKERNVKLSRRDRELLPWLGSFLVMWSLVFWQLGLW
jgi:hypothetical protein